MSLIPDVLDGPIHRDPPASSLVSNFVTDRLPLSNLGFVERARVMRIVIHHRQAAQPKASVPERPIALPP